MNKYKELLENLNYENITEMLHHCNGYGGYFEDLFFYENDDYFFENYFTDKIDVARAICYGNYDYMEPYVRFNAYGNLESLSSYEMEEEIMGWKEEIVKKYLELYSDNNTYPSDNLKMKLYDFYEESESE